MTHIFDERNPGSRVYPFPGRLARPKPSLPPPAAVSFTIVGEAAMDSYRFYLGQGSTPAAVMAALDTTVREIAGEPGFSLEITSRTWDLLGLPLLTVGLATPPPRPHSPRCG